MIFSFLRLSNCGLSLKGQRQRVPLNLKTRSRCWKEVMKMVDLRSIHCSFPTLISLPPYGLWASSSVTCLSAWVPMSPWHQLLPCVGDNGAFQQAWRIWVFQVGSCIFLSCTSPKFLLCHFSLLFCCSFSGRDWDRPSILHCLKFRMFVWQEIKAFLQAKQKRCEPVILHSGAALTTGFRRCGRGRGRHGQLAGSAKENVLPIMQKSKLKPANQWEKTHQLCRQDLHFFHYILSAIIKNWPFTVLYSRC